MSDERPGSRGPETTAGVRRVGCKRLLERFFILLWSFEIRRHRRLDGRYLLGSEHHMGMQSEPHGAAHPMWRGTARIFTDRLPAAQIRHARGLAARDAVALQECAHGLGSWGAQMLGPIVRGEPIPIARTSLLACVVRALAQ